MQEAYWVLVLSAKFAAFFCFLFSPSASSFQKRLWNFSRCPQSTLPLLILYAILLFWLFNSLQPLSFHCSHSHSLLPLLMAKMGHVFSKIVPDTMHFKAVEFVNIFPGFCMSKQSTKSYNRGDVFWWMAEGPGVV